MTVCDKICVINIIVLCLILCRSSSCSELEKFIPVKDMVISGDAAPSSAESLAVEHFNKAIQKMTGKTLPVIWGMDLKDRPCIKIGNRSTHPALFRKHKYSSKLQTTDADIANQSYVIDLDSGSNPIVIAMGYGDGLRARNFLGMSYALGDLLRRFDTRNGKWGFVLPDKPVVESPSVPDRRLYLMVTFYINPGLALERMSDAEIDDYVDMLVDARYSQVTFFQWSTSYLYPGIFESLRPMNEMTHKAIRHFIGHARKRGLQVYEMITPDHVEPSLISKDPRLGAKGNYAGTGVCWSQPDARELARKVAQLEMVYYGPVDGYTVWFYDPAGCFCPECKEHQADRIFDQLMMVEDLSRTISPDAKFEAVLWPTWVFSQTKGIDYADKEVKEFITSFLSKCAKHFGSGKFTIMDTSEREDSNIYNGLVDQKVFRRNALLHSVMGATIEQAYPFAALKLGYTVDQTTEMKNRKVDAGTLTIGYAPTNIPTVFTFADSLYEGENSGDDSIRSYARAVAKGDSFAPYLDLLLAGDTIFPKPKDIAQDVRSYKQMDDSISAMEKKLDDLEKCKDFYGDRDWLRGYVKAQRWYWKLAQASDEKSFEDILEQFKADVGSIPMYNDYMSGYWKVSRTMVPYAAGRHVVMYWRFYARDGSMVGAPNGL
ncbi:MAG: hypothetical protein ACYC27_07690 [Armatimonadota bacterium]